MPAFALTIFIGAFLLFQVQPLIGKYILPWFGGGPGVWTTCMLFFQVLLLGGYAYAHFSSRWLQPRRQALVHLGLLAAALALLPITPADSWKPHGSDNPTLHILALLTASLGVPYFVLSATGPLVQQWFSRTHPGASPYRLYALSNAGSLLALLSYPFFFEAHFTRKTQAALWAGGLVAYVLCCGFCALKLWRSARDGGQEASREGRPAEASQSLATGQPPPPTEQATSNTPSPAPASSGPPPVPCPSPLDQLLWLLLPACASVLLLATTNKLCQDVAVIPFLWVVPLGLYLLSFIICFDSPRWYWRLPFTLALAGAAAGLCWALFKGSDWPLWKQVSVYAGGLFVCCLVCHGELYRLRPAPQYLTKFYLGIAAGGALGGVFVAVVAPLVFMDYCELNWGLFACGLLFLVVCATDKTFRRFRLPTCLLLSLGVAALGITLWRQGRKSEGDVVCRSRNFYGVLTVYEYRKNEPKEHYFLLQHGRITHGIQFGDPERAGWATTYYGAESGVGLALSALPAGPRRIGLVGLGTGSLMAYARPGDYFRIYEINPEVKRLAKSRFTYLGSCAGKAEVALGDARLSLEQEPPQQFDLLALDAFSGDAIPVHLLTREAFELYGRHLKTNSVIAVHISNHFLDLEPVVENLARQFGYKLAVIDYDDEEGDWWLYSSTWILLSRDEAILNSPQICAVSIPTKTKAVKVPRWTDDFASLFQILK